MDSDQILDDLKRFDERLKTVEDLLENLSQRVIALEGIVVNYRGALQSLINKLEEK